MTAHPADGSRVAAALAAFCAKAKAAAKQRSRRQELAKPGVQRARIDAKRQAALRQIELAEAGFAAFRSDLDRPSPEYDRALKADHAGKVIQRNRDLLNRLDRQEAALLQPLAPDDRAEQAREARRENADLKRTMAGQGFASDAEARLKLIAAITPKAGKIRAGDIGGPLSWHPVKAAAMAREVVEVNTDQMSALIVPLPGAFADKDELLDQLAALRCPPPFHVAWKRHSGRIQGPHMVWLIPNPVNFGPGGLPKPQAMYRVVVAKLRTLLTGLGAKPAWVPPDTVMQNPMGRGMDGFFSGVDLATLKELYAALAHVAVPPKPRLPQEEYEARMLAGRRKGQATVAADRSDATMAAITEAVKQMWEAGMKLTVSGVARRADRARNTVPTYLPMVLARLRSEGCSICWAQYERTGEVVPNSGRAGNSGTPR